MPGFDKTVPGGPYSGSAKICRLDPGPAVELPRTDAGELVVWIGSDARLLTDVFWSIVELLEGVGGVAAESG